MIIAYFLLKIGDDYDIYQIILSVLLGITRRFVVKVLPNGHVHSSFYLIPNKHLIYPAQPL